MASIEQYFAGMDKAPMFGSGQYFSADFKGVVKTRSMKVNNGFKGLCFIAEFEVVESNTDKDPVGSTRSYVVKMGPENRNAFADIKALVFAVALQTDPKKAGAPEQNPALHAQAAEIVKAACEPEYAKKIGVPPDALEGLPVRLETWGKPTRPSAKNPQGGVFTVHSWYPAAG